MTILFIRSTVCLSEAASCSLNDVHGNSSNEKATTDHGKEQLAVLSYSVAGSRNTDSDTVVRRRVDNSNVNVVDVILVAALVIATVFARLFASRSALSTALASLASLSALSPLATRRHRRRNHRGTGGWVGRGRAAWGTRRDRRRR